MYVQAIPIYPGTIRTTRRGTILLDLMRIMRGCVFQMIIATSPKSTLKAIKCTGTLVLLCIAVERVKRQAQVALTASAIPCPRGLNVCPKSASGATAAPKTPLAQVDCATVVPALAQQKYRKENRAARRMIVSMAWRVYVVRAALGYAASSRTRTSALKGISTCVPVVRRVAIRPVMNTRV